MAAAAHGDEQLVLARKAHAACDVSGIGATGNQGGTLVDQPIPDLPRLVIAVALRPQQPAVQSALKLGDRRLPDRRAALADNRVRQRLTLHS